MSRNIGIGEVRTKLLDTDHKQWNCGMGLYDPEKVFFREDPNGKVYVDDKLVKIVKTKDESNLVMIGDKLYKFVTIGDQVWLAENLALKTTNSVAREGYPEFGLYYPYTDIDEIENSVDGWHIPTEEEIRKLLLSNTPDNAHRVQSTNYKSVWPDATNSSEFSAVPAAHIGDTNLNRALLWFHAGYAAVLANSILALSGPTTTLSFCARLIKDTEPVEIGGKTYKTAKIGSQIWTIENLDLEFPEATYYNDDPSQSYGLLYRGRDMESLNFKLLEMDAGFHVPTKIEMLELVESAGGSSVAGKNLKSSDSWNSGVGLDSYRFNLKSAGLRVPTNYQYKGSNASMWTCVPDFSTSTDSEYRVSVGVSDVASMNFLSWNFSAPVRLVKDTEKVEIAGRQYHTARMGDYIVMIENLDAKLDGIEIGPNNTPNTPAAWYYNNDEAGETAANNGLLYNGYCIDLINAAAPEGWHVPTSVEMQAIRVTGIDDASYSGLNMKVQAAGGLNAIRFNGALVGTRNGSGVFESKNVLGRFWLDNTSGANRSFITLQQNLNNAGIYAVESNRAYSIRLVKYDPVSSSLSKGFTSIIEDEDKPIEDEKKTEEVIEEKETIKEENKR